MGVVFTKESAYAQEMRKWEAYPTEFGKGEKPFQFREYPKRMYRFEHVSGKGIVQADAQTAADEIQEANLRSRGFCFGQQDAYDAIERQQTEYGKLAAEREFEIAHGRISDKAAKEVRAAEAEAGAVHLPGVPEKKRPGRRKKVVETVVVG